MFRITCAAAALAVIGLASSAFATSYGTNLIVNPGAEAVTGVTSSGPQYDLWGGLVATPTGWTLNGVMAVQYYFSPANGTYLFNGGHQNTATATQDIDISDLAAAVATGNVGYDFSALLGGYIDQTDQASLTLEFRGGGNSLGSDILGPVSAADRGNLTGMLSRSNSGMLPLGTDTLRVTFTASASGVTSQSWNDGYGDNFALSLTAPPVVPEPASLGLLGLGALALLRRRA